MILLLGATGYVGEAFQQQAARLNLPLRSLSRSEVDYTSFRQLRDFLAKEKPEFVVNCAGYTGKPNVDACEQDWAGTLQGNALFAQTLAQATEVTGIPCGHVSSGCIYAGGWVQENGEWKVVADLNTPHYRDLAKNHPERFRGFSEDDEPNFTFRNLPCSFYSGTKALGEEVMAEFEHLFIWRLRIPFDHIDNPRNYLTKVQKYPKVYDNLNSLSQRQDFARACLETWVNRVPFGTYNVTNPGFVSTRQVIGMIEDILKPEQVFEFWDSDEEFYRVAAKTPRSNCLMDTSKLAATGITLEPVTEALERALTHWQSPVVA